MHKEFATGTIFHIGGPKTGSSALQSWFVNYRHFLEAEGITYPKPDDLKRAENYQISSGNAKQWHLNPGQQNLRPGELWSAEQLFSSEAFRQVLSERVSLLETTVTILGYYRNPVDWVVSGWMQNVKREGWTKTLTEHLETTDFPQLRSLLAWLEMSEDKGINIRLRNYDLHKNALLKHFVTQLLGLDSADSGVFEAQSVRVNRSPTCEEIEMFRAINSSRGGNKWLASRISDQLIERLPMMETPLPFLQKEQFMILHERSNALIQKINLLLEPEERIELTHAFSENKVVVAEKENGLSIEWFKELGTIIGELPTLRSNQARINKLKQLALNIQAGENLNKNDAAELLDIANSLGD